MTSPARTAGKMLLDEVALDRTLSRIAHEIIEANPALDEIAPPLTLKRLARDLGFPVRARPCDLDATAWAALYRSVRRTR